jgi:hypothetical protein
MGKLHKRGQIPQFQNWSQPDELEPARVGNWRQDSFLSVPGQFIADQLMSDDHPRTDIQY